MLVLIILSSGLFLVLGNKSDNTPQHGVLGTKKDQQNTASATVSSQPKYFSGYDFQKLYDQTAYPNTELIVEPPKITGNVGADNRIRQVAESRGYKLRSTPVWPIIKTTEPDVSEDNLLQPLAYQAWQALKAEADKDRMPIALSSGYRSVDLQRRFFAARLSATGVSNEDIAAGKADAAVLSVLHTMAPPGYSRHHTGYTMDLICKDGTGQTFKLTKCFNWLKANNYAKAKQAGLIPSYPEDLSDQGPEPEAWEYVWVGTSKLF